MNSVISALGFMRDTNINMLVYDLRFPNENAATVVEKELLV